MSTGLVSTVHESAIVGGVASELERFSGSAATRQDSMKMVSSAA